MAESARIWSTIHKEKWGAIEKCDSFPFAVIFSFFEKWKHTFFILRICGTCLKMVKSIKFTYKSK